MSSRRFRCAVCGAPQTRRRPMFRIDHDPDVWAHVDCASPEAWEAQLRRVCSGLARLPRSRPSATGRHEQLSEGVIPIRDR